MFRGLILILCIIWGGQVWAAPSVRDLRKIQSQIREEKETQKSFEKQAKSVASEVADVQKQMVKAGAEVQNFEEVVSDLEGNLKELEKQQKEVESRLDLRQEQLIRFLSGLQKMAINPPEKAFFYVGNPVDNLRSALLLKEIGGPLQAKTERLRNDLTMLATLQAATKAQATQMKVASIRLEENRQSMEKLLKQKSVLQKHFETQSAEAKKRADSLGKQAKDIRDLLSKLEEERKRKREEEQLAGIARQEKPSFWKKEKTLETDMGKLSLPAKGRIIQTYGQETEGGLQAKGLTIETRSGAQVTTPSDGVVLFAGPFKGYGNLIIVEHAGGYHSLLAGLDEMYPSVGQNVLSQEPIGKMAGKTAPKLYVELRKDGHPVNPEKWYLSRKGS
ncbi:MAG: peptidoglycan DD-metalloendopeptidase family protein [Alphaproteobacteria bacterium]|nr:peptidoglycan DD-metalloendopeptidase family protein [Alphaproteobacteria bacterium]